MKMYIHSSYGLHECIPMEQQDITIVQAENNQFTVTATDQEESKVASESCCDLSPETPF